MTEETPQVFSASRLPYYSVDELNYHFSTARERFSQLNDIVISYNNNVKAALDNPSLSPEQKDYQMRINSEFRDLATEMRDQAKKVWFSCKIEGELRGL